MDYARLLRAHGTQDGVFGCMGPWTTVEEEDLQNKRNVSCIPVGAYVCRRTFYNRGGYETFEVTDVPDRSDILFHILNTEEDTEGCIGVTSRLGILKVNDEDGRGKVHKLAGLASRKAFKAFMEKWKGVDEFILIVEWA